MTLTLPLKFEYIWLDGTTPEPSLRSKTKILDGAEFGITYVSAENDVSPDDLPIWYFDGSSTLQAEGRYSDCALKPVKVIPDPLRLNAFLVMTEVLTPDLKPHLSNTRALFADAPELWFGFEQEYVLMSGGRPLGFPANGFPRPQGPYYCAVGHDNVSGRKIVERHLDACLDAGLSITGINAEVLLGQWEYQLLGKGAKDAADSLWLARYLLMRICEEEGVEVTHTPKPLEGDWNGSGLHTNFSTKEMREEGGQALFEAIFATFERNHQRHIEAYGSDNHKRLTGQHETQSIEKFTTGVSDRGSSIRIPQTTSQEWKGYLEDRRPASNADPYKIAKVMIDSLAEVAQTVI